MAAGGGAPTRAPGRPQGSPYSRRPDWDRIGLVGAGLAVGLLVGVGVTLLAAPASGAETRTQLARRSRRMRRQLGDGWDDLRDELRRAARQARRRMRRRRIEEDDM